MRRLFSVVVCLSILCILFADAQARDAVRPEYRISRYWSPEQYAGYLSELDPGLRGMYSSAAVDTYNIVWYDFEDNNWQGWTQVDNHAQAGTFFVWLYHIGQSKLCLL